MSYASRNFCGPGASLISVTMLISLEALAMAGASNVQFALDTEEWERRDSEPNPPPHLLAEEYYNDEYCVTFPNHQEKLDRNGEIRPECLMLVKTTLRALVTLCMIMRDVCRRGSHPTKQRHL
ncbi:hypothetical protein VNO77_00934 [Canavalia gladiata]|uniref:Uncharacterized protein n=1 Tax=Canavalia gladiata TaxID=3824 RepID=A0AAN9MS60_CANGL